MDEHTQQPDEGKFTEGLEAVVMSGTDADVRSYVRNNFMLLNEKSRTELLLNMFADIVQEEAEEQDFVTELRERGIAAVKALERMDEETKK